MIENWLLFMKDFPSQINGHKQLLNGPTDDRLVTKNEIMNVGHF